jgi:hypothetical protein
MATIGLIRQSADMKKQADPLPSQEDPEKKALQKALEEAQLKIKALNTLIDVAEDKFNCSKQYVDMLNPAAIAISMTENGDPYEKICYNRTPVCTKSNGSVCPHSFK